MESLAYNFKMDDEKSVFSNVNDNNPTTTQESFVTSTASVPTSLGDPQVLLSPLAPPFQGGNRLLSLIGQQEPLAGDTAPSPSEIDEMLSFRMNNTDLIYDELEHGSHSNYYSGSRADTMPHSGAGYDGGSSASSLAKNAEMMTFDFLVKSVTSAHNYVSMLTPDQLSVLRSMRPELLFEILHEFAKNRQEKRYRRVLPTECAFCKNNGENEECYSTHALKDSRGRVLCPVLRAFRCPRCGATGDRAHTIKYCPENKEVGSDCSSIPSRRHVSPSASLLLGMPLQTTSMHSASNMGNGLGNMGLNGMGNGNMGGFNNLRSQGLPTPSPSPSAASANMPHSSFWSNFGINDRMN